MKLGARRQDSFSVPKASRQLAGFCDEHGRGVADRGIRPIQKLAPHPIADGKARHLRILW
jgi:hypothetical protein